jgi:hypothetical protein
MTIGMGLILRAEIPGKPGNPGQFLAGASPVEPKGLARVLAVTE